MPGSPAIARFGVFELDLQSGELRRHGLRVALPDQSFRVLRLLLERRGQLVTRDEFRRALWADDTFVDFEHGLNAAVKRVRDALGDTAENPRFIETLPKRGYRFLAPVDLPAPAPPEAEAGPGEPYPAPRPAGDGRPLEVAPATDAAVARPRPRGVTAAVLALGMAGALVGAAALSVRRDTTTVAASPPPIKVVLPPPPGTQIPVGPAAAHMAFRPDGRMIAFAAGPLALPSMLYVQAMDSVIAHKVDDTEGAGYPCWSPDGQRVAYYAAGTMRTIAATGGAPTVLGPRGLYWSGCAWGPDDVILVGDSVGPIAQVSATGGGAAPVTTLNRGRRETGHVWPSFLPDGRHFLYVAVSTLPEHRGVYVTSLDGGAPRRIVAAGGRAAYVRPGYLMWVEQGTIVAQPFDAARLTLTGAPSRIVDGVAYNISNGHAAFAPSESGVVAYREGPGIAGMQGQLVVVDRDGATLQRVGDAETYWRPAFSPDGRLLAAERIDRRSGTSEVWLFDLERNGVGTRFATGQEVRWPAWSPDGTTLAFVEESAQGWSVRARDPAGAQVERTIWTSPQPIGAIDWLPDGRSLVMQRLGEDGRHDIWQVSVDTGQQPRAILATPFDEASPRVSPDGRWLAYVSFETGRPEVYVRSTPAGGPTWRVSTDGGRAPRWSGDGRELFYRNGANVHAVAMADPQRPEPGLPRRLFTAFDPSGSVDYSVDRDGRRFVFVMPAADDFDHGMPPITLLINWQERLRPQDRRP